MGFMDKVKGFLNIGGPKIAIKEIEQPITGKFGVVTGTAVFTTKRAARIVKFTQKFLKETTTGTGDEKKTETTVIAMTENELDVDLVENESIEWPIHISYDSSTLTERMAESGGMLGAIGKAGQFAGKFSEKGLVDYFVEIAADVVGTPIDPSDKAPVRAALDD